MNQLKATLRVLIVKAETGIFEADLLPLRSALDRGIEVDKVSLFFFFNFFSTTFLICPFLGLLVMFF